MRNKCFYNFLILPHKIFITKEKMSKFTVENRHTHLNQVTKVNIISSETKIQIGCHLIRCNENIAPETETPAKDA